MFLQKGLPFLLIILIFSACLPVKSVETSPLPSAYIQPTAAPTSTLTPSPEPSVTMQPSPTLANTPTSEPTFTPQPSATLTPTKSAPVSLFYPDWAKVSYPPFNLHDPKGVENPVLTAGDVTEVDAKFIADPFMFYYENSVWYMFFEVFNRKTQHGDIGLAVSLDGLHWKYDRIVLDEPFHLSYPDVFEYAGHYYMIPEAGQTGQIRLYEADNFPYGWHYKESLIYGKPYRDPTIFAYDGLLWIYAVVDSDLYLFSSNILWSGWTEHPRSPVITDDSHITRPGGRTFVYNGRTIIRLAQDDYPAYGKDVRAFQVNVLNLRRYSEEEIPESPVLRPSPHQDWVRDGIHQMDPWWTGDYWLVAFDGRSYKEVKSDYAIGIRIGDNPNP